MVQRRKNKVFPPNGDKSATNRNPSGSSPVNPPPNKMGGKTLAYTGDVGCSLVTGRCRINVSVPDGVYAALVEMAGKTGMSVSQLGLSAIMAGLPAMSSQLDAIERMGRRND